MKNNVYFVYHPDMGSNPDNTKQWYPGNQYVDWTLASAYGEGIDRRIEQSPEILNAYRTGIANSFIFHKTSTLLQP
jgi:hypothetical protein